MVPSHYCEEVSLMELTISADTVIQAAALAAALGTLGGIIYWCFKFVSRQKAQDKELAAVRKELTVICYGVLACLKGLKE